MLVEFSVKNFRSFRDEAVLSLAASKDKAHPDNCFDAGGVRLLKSAAVYGANASGKSNLVDAVGSMRAVVLSSSRRGPAEPIEVAPFKLDQRFARQPTEFEVQFVLNGTRYEYGFGVTAKRVTGEWLFAYPSARAQRWFQRTWDATTGKTDWYLSPIYLRGRKQQLAEETPENVLFLSSAAGRNHEQLRPLYEWFAQYLRVVPAQVRFSHVTTAEFAREDGTRKAVLRLLGAADLGISDVAVSERDVLDHEVLVPDELSSAEKERVVSSLREQRRYEVRTGHRQAPSGNAVEFELGEESDGTQRLFSLIGPWMESLGLGYTVFVDELHASLHPLLTRMLVEMFHNPRLNTKGAQLVFTTHDVTLLDNEMLRRDQVWFTEKDPDGNSHLYSLYEYKDRPRREGAWQKGYLAGRYGSLPVLGGFDPEQWE
jgi:hypothetical protein